VESQLPNPYLLSIHDNLPISFNSIGYNLSSNSLSKTPRNQSVKKAGGFHSSHTDGRTYTFTTCNLGVCPSVAPSIYLATSRQLYQTNRFQLPNTERDYSW
jgi:hypothetical protein